MKIRNISLFAGAASALISSAEASAAYIGLGVEYSDFFFSNHPNAMIRDAWNAGPVNQYNIYRLYANFDSNTPADRVNAVSGTSFSPFSINLVGGTIHNYTEDVHGKTTHYNTAFTGQIRIERSWDSYVTIGNAITGGATQLSPGFPVETDNLGYSGGGVGPSANVAWFITSSNPQGLAVATAPGQATSTPGVYRVLLAQIVVTQGTTSMNGDVQINVNGVEYANNQFILWPPAQPVRGDATGEGWVDVQDLLTVINAWGPCQGGGPCGPWCAGDVAPTMVGDCVVDVNDLLLVINNWTS